MGQSSSYFDHETIRKIEQTRDRLRIRKQQRQVAETFAAVSEFLDGVWSDTPMVRMTDPEWIRQQAMIACDTSESRC